MKLTSVKGLSIALLLTASLMAMNAAAAQDVATPVPAGEVIIGETPAGEVGGAAQTGETVGETVGGEVEAGAATTGETGENSVTTEEGAVVGEVTDAEAEEGASTAEAEAEGAEEVAVSPLTPLGINVGFLLAQIANFLLLFGLLTIFLWRPLMNMLDNRGATIQKGLEDAAAGANARRNAEAEAERISAAARAESTRFADEGRTRGEELARQVEAQARTDAEQIRTEARARATDETNRQLGDLRSQVAAIAIAVSQRLIGESLDQTRQQALINDFFAKVPADARAMGGQQVEVVSAMPLTQEEQQRVQSETGAQSITYTVDPAILGGLIIRTQDRVVDGSVRSNLDQLSSSLR